MLEIEHYESAFCVPGERIGPKKSSFGIYDASGHVAQNSEIHTASWVSQPIAKISEPHSDLQVFGPSMFAGSADKQFGFVLLNSIGRLWALDMLPAETSIVFGSRLTKKHVIYSHLSQVLRSLGINNPILVLRTATRFEDLYVPTERFGEVRGGCGTAEFYDWIDRKWKCKSPQSGGGKLYVTRSAMGPMAGRFVCEDQLERLLQDEGYEIYAPEQHSLVHQVETFKAAEKVVFAEGSALHLFSLIRQPHQLSAVIQRRHELPSVMVAQMADRDGLATLAIDAIKNVRFPPRRGDHLARAELDFEVLRNALIKSDLISGSRWKAPTTEEVDASM